MERAETRSLNDPGDADTGNNDLLNFPVVTEATANAGRLVVRGYIDTPDPKYVRIEFFVTEPGGDPSGHGGGKTFLGSRNPNPTGRFTAVLPRVEPGQRLTATATDFWGNTSEFAANVVVETPG
jgi:hypothetical protein